MQNDFHQNCYLALNELLRQIWMVKDNGIYKSISKSTY